jgi:hypothetical protein
MAPVEAKNEDSKKSDSATKMLTSFPCILIASFDSRQQIQIVSIFLLSISIFSADVIHMIIAPAYAPIDSARLRRETVSAAGWRVSSLGLAFCTYGRTFLEGPATHLCLVLLVCRTYEKKTDFAGPP